MIIGLAAVKGNVFQIDTQTDRQTNKKQYLTALIVKTILILPK
jgi:hypothetical protein